MVFIMSSLSIVIVPTTGAFKDTRTIVSFITSKLAFTWTVYPHKSLQAWISYVSVLERGSLKKKKKKLHFFSLNNDSAKLKVVSRAEVLCDWRLISH